MCNPDGNLSDISVLVGDLCELFLPVNGVQKSNHSFKSDCQTNHNRPGKQLGDIWCACTPSLFQKNYFVHSTILLFTEKLKDALWNLLWRAADRLLDDGLDRVTIVGLMIMFLNFICTIDYAFKLSTSAFGKFKGSHKILD